MGYGVSLRAPRLGRGIQIGPYWLAVISTLIGFVLRYLIDPWLGDQMPYVTFLVSVALTGLYAGARPALLSTALGAAVAYFIFVPPRYHWGFGGMSDATGFLSYLAAAVGIVVLTRARNKAHEAAKRSLQERINAEHKLHDTRKLLQMFMDNRPGCSYLRDPTGRYVYYNNEAHRLLGIPGDNLSKKSGVLRRLDSQDQQLLALKGQLQFVDKVKVQDKERYWLTTKFLFIDQEKQEFVGSLSIDITEQMKAEEVVLETERLMAASQMVALVAHEINNPLAAVTSSLFLLGRAVKTEAARGLVAIAQDELARLTRIARLAVGFYRETEPPVAVDVCALIDDVLTGVAAQFSRSPAQTEYDLKWRSKFVTCTSQLRQVVENVVTNSFESGANRIRIRVAWSTDWRRPTRAGLRISILDNGCGMSREQREQAFEPFFSTKAEKGSGLGLWVSRAIALRNGGRMMLRSTNRPARSGTCVSVFLPGHHAAGPGISLGAYAELDGTSHKESRSTRQTRV